MEVMEKIPLLPTHIPQHIQQKIGHLKLNLITKFQ